MHGFAVRSRSPRGRKRMVAAAAAVALVLAGCGSQGASSNPGKVVELSAFGGDNFLAGPLYVARDQGFYEDEGLTYDLEFPGSTIRAIQSLVGGEVGISWTDGFGILTANAQGFPLISVYTSYKGSSYGMVVKEDSPIQEWDVDSLRGATIGITAFDGGEVPGLRAALVRLGLTDEGSDYTLKPVGDGGSEAADAIESGDVDVMAASLPDFTALRNRGVKMRTITPDYLAHEFPGHSYAVTPEQLKDNREQIVKFLRAHAKAIVWLRANPKCVAKLATEEAPESVGDLDEQGVGDTITDLWIDLNSDYFDPESPSFHKLGEQDPQGWSDYQDFLLDANVEGEDGGTVTEKQDLSVIVDNSLIDEVNDFDYDAEAAKAKAWEC